MKIKIMKFNTEIQKYRKLYFRSIISPNTSAEFNKNIISIQKYRNTEIQKAGFFNLPFGKSICVSPLPLGEG